MAEDRMTKTEAAAFLGISSRSVERYTQQGKLHPVYVPTANGNEAQYNLEELRKIKDEKMPVHTSEIVAVGGEVSGVVGGEEFAFSVIEKLTEILERIVLEKTKPSPFFVYEMLTKADVEEWLLPTKIVKEAIGVTPKGEIFVWANFKFVKIKQGRRVFWKVESMG